MSFYSSTASRSFAALALIAVTAANVVGQAADPMNLGFERRGLTVSTTAARWFTAGQGYIATLDSVAPQSGARSLRMQARRQLKLWRSNREPSRRCHCRENRQVRGFVRTEGITEGYAGLWMRVDAGSKILILDNMGSRGITGTTAWAPYDITLHADSSATVVYFGAIFPGNGTAWFDSFSIEIDGKPYVGESAPAWHASALETKWVHDHAIPLATSDPNAPFGDLAPIGRIVGDARIVSLGEGTHGTSEFFQMKHRLTKYLAQNKGFTVFAIEANMPEARRVNEYACWARRSTERRVDGRPVLLVAGFA